MDDFFFFMFDAETDTTVQVPVEELGITDEQELEFIQDETIRKVWDQLRGEWYFSIIDVIEYLTGTDRPRKYWSDLKKQLLSEGSQLSENIGQLKMPSKKDGKMYKTDCASTEQLLRLIQSIPSKKVEPLKQWLAHVGKERLDEMADPEKAMERAIMDYREKGYSEEWISQRMRSIDIRKEMTAEWDRSGVKTGKEYAILTNILTQSWSGKTVQQYKQYKGLKKESLKDNMTNTELVLNALAEISTTELSRAHNPNGFEESKDIAKSGGQIAANARKELESKLGRSVISPLNAQTPNLLDDKN